MTTPQKPITERSNDLTLSIDLSKNIFNQLMHVDQQLFSSYKDFKSIYYFQKELKTLADLLAKGGVALSGCGTSGRIAWVCTRAWNNYLAQSSNNSKKAAQYHYLIAGGDSALIRSEEVAEDNVNQVISDDIQALVGISCGLSAPYVAAQIKNMMETNRRAIMLGFNPVELARDRAIFPDGNNDGTSQVRTFKDLLEYASTTNLLTIINPTLGPEAITGSTRMKGGSATKFLLDAAFIASQTNQDIFQILFQYETTFRYTYNYNPLMMDRMNHLIDICGNSLNSNNGHIYFLGHDSSGILGLVDASECVPTYGANFEDIRGFILNGWSTMGNNEGPQVESKGDAFKISTQNFEDNILPQLTENDTVIFLYIDGYGQSVRDEVHASYERIIQRMGSSPSPHLAQFFVSEMNSPVKVLPHISEDSVVHIELPRLSPEGMSQFPAFGELSMKFLLNAISTGAHILKGTVYTNQMINVRVSNNKLFYRAIQIISRIAKVSEQEAREALLRSIYERENMSSVQKPEDSDDNSIVEQHIRNSVRNAFVVPVAILLARDADMTIEEALKTIEKNPRIRQVLEQLEEK